MLMIAGRLQGVGGCPLRFGEHLDQCGRGRGQLRKCRPRDLPLGRFLLPPLAVELVER